MPTYGMYTLLPGRPLQPGGVQVIFIFFQEPVVLPASPQPNLGTPVVIPAAEDEILLTDPVTLPVTLEPNNRVLRWILGIPGSIASAAEWVFGLGCMMVALAVIAAVPVLQFLSLGYMLECAGRIVRTGKFSMGFIGIRLAARAGGAAGASWLLLLPIRYLGDLAASAAIIDPAGPMAARLRVSVVVLSILVPVHLVLSIARGGRLRQFLWPFHALWFWRQISAGGSFARARDSTLGLLASLRLPYYWWLGFRVFVATLFWLAFPVSLLALGHARAPIAPLFGFIGAAWLAAMALYIPIIQARMAAKNSMAPMFEWREATRTYLRAPWAISFALVLSLLSAIPLYLLKVEAVPDEALWLPGLFFVVFIFPARFLMGFAVSLAEHRERPSHWLFRWSGRLPLLPAALLYVLFVFLSQYISWSGIIGLYEQHAFLLPVPYVGM